MKKFIIGAAATASLMLSVASCSGDKAASDSKIDKQLSDSVSVYIGKTIGSYVLADYMRFAPDHQTPEAKDDIFKGIRIVLGEKPSDATMIGMRIGVELLDNINQLRQQGVEVNEKDVLKYFKEAFDADSLDMEAVRANSTRLNELMQQVQQIAMEAEADEDIDQAELNLVQGQEYIKNIVKNDPEVKVTDSGLAYKIEKAGDSTPIYDNSIVTLNYVGQFPDGQVFDQNADGQPATFAPKDVVPGFGEAVKLAGKGGRIRAYLPAELAYGERGAGPIGPNQTIVFDIEVLDVNTPE